MKTTEIIVIQNGLEALGGLGSIGDLGNIANLGDLGALGTFGGLTYDLRGTVLFFFMPCYKEARKRTSRDL